MKIYGGNHNWVNKDSYPSGGSRDGFGGSSNNGSSNLSGGSSGSYGSSSTRSSVDSSSAVSTFNSILAITKSGPRDGRLFMGEKIMNLQHGNLTNEQIGQLMQYLQWQGLNLDKFDVSYNKLGFGAVENIFCTFSLQRSGTSLYNIKYMNLSNNQIGDDGAKCIASHIANGNYPHLKALDVSGNQISNTGNGYFANALKSSKIKSIIVTLTKYATLQRKDYYGTFLKNSLKQAEHEGISTEGIVIDKSLWGELKAKSKMAFQIAAGYIKCKVELPTNTAEIATEIVITGSKFLNRLDDAYCFNSSMYDFMHTFEGISTIIRDLELMGVNDVVNSQ